MYLRMALLFIFFNISFLNAYDFAHFKAISWNWLAIILLILFFLVLLLSIIRDFKRKKKELNTILVQEKSNKYEQNCYLNDINNENLKATKELGNSLNVLDSSDDKKIIETLIKYQKDIFANTQEEHIFLNIATNKNIGSNAIFNITDALQELNNHGLLKRTEINITDKISYPIIANRKVIQSIIFLLIRLQIRENHIKNPKIQIHLDRKDILHISIPKELKLQEEILYTINNNLEPQYNNEDKKYYGVYLYLLNKLSDRIQGNLEIDITNNSNYNISVNIPVDLDKKIQNINVDIRKKLKTKKSALIISSNIENSNKIEAYLKKYNFTTSVELSTELNKEIPNFLNFDMVIMDAKLYEPILSDYILSVKKYSDLKIIALEEKDKIYNYQENLIDSKVGVDNLYSNLNSTILKLYSNELIEEKNIIKNKDNSNSKDLSIPKRSKILIADDDRTNLHILEYLIKQYNIEVYTAKDGIEALKILEKNKIDLIILDSIMPNLDGFETIKKIRANESYNSTPVVIHTSFSLKKNSIESIFKLGFDSYLPKPFNKNELKALLERYIPISELKTQEIIQDKLKNKDDLEEFLAIYSNSDKLIERYIKENRKEQAISILKDLKNVSNKIGAFKFAKTLNQIEDNLYKSKDVDSNLLYTLSTNLTKLKSNIAKKLQN